MNVKNKMLGLTIATAAALSFATIPFTSATAQSNKVPCYGVNGCKGQSACKTANSGCKGTNACKGQGYLMLTEKDCAKQKGTTTMPEAPAPKANSGY